MIKTSDNQYYGEDRFDGSVDADNSRSAISLGGVSGGLSIYVFSSIWKRISSETIIADCFYLLIAALLGVLAWYFLRVAVASFLRARANIEIRSEGILVEYPLCASKMIPWGAFQEICICHLFIPTRAEVPKAYVIVACVMHGEKRHWLDGRWSAGRPLHYNRIISFDYTTDIIRELQIKCPKQVVDLRDTLRYRL